MTANSELEDIVLRHEVAVRRFARGVEKRALTIVAAADAATRWRMLAALRKSRGAAALERLREVVRHHVPRGLDRAHAALHDELVDFAVHEAEWLARAINEASPVEFALELPAAPEEFSWNGIELADWFEKLTADKIERLERVARLGIEQGSTTDEMARAISRGFAISLVHARALVRTATTAAGAEARQALLDQNAGIIRGVRWVATLDGRTSKICAARDGMVYPVDRGPRPPAHPQCRSTTVPVLKSWRELGFDDMDEDAALSDRPFVRDTRRVKDIPKAERAALIGTVRSNQSYQSWLRRQDAAFQDDVLGPTRGRLFRRGGLSLDKFVDESGRDYTIDELRRREAAAFRKAGVE